MGRRTRRYFGDGDRQDLLNAVGTCRKATVAASSKAPISGPEYVAAGRLTAALDDMAETLTGDREHFWLKSHSTHG